jgi:4-oxalocrotonate tautomerase
MPVVRVDMWEGRTAEMKAKLIKDITEVFTEIGVPSAAVTVIITDVPKTNWGTGGKQAAKKEK